MPKVSILLTTWNRSELLNKVVESVFNQTYQDFELIILDDNSHNKEQIKLLSKLWNKDKVIIYKSNVTNENRYKTVRYSENINVGLKIAKGEYITYLTDDTLYHPDRLKLMVDYLDSYPSVSVVYGGQRGFKVENGKLIPLETRDYKKMLTDAYCKVDHTSVMHRRNVIDVVGLWTTNLDYWQTADGEFWMKLNKHGYNFYPIGEITEDYYFHADNKSKKIDNMTKGILPI